MSTGFFSLKFGGGTKYSEKLSVQPKEGNAGSHPWVSISPHIRGGVDGWSTDSLRCQRHFAYPRRGRRQGCEHRRLCHRPSEIGESAQTCRQLPRIRNRFRASRRRDVWWMGSRGSQTFEGHGLKLCTAEISSPALEIKQFFQRLSISLQRENATLLLC